MEIIDNRAHVKVTGLISSFNEYLKEVIMCKAVC
jgi:hypothetical protein